MHAQLLVNCRKMGVDCRRGDPQGGCAFFVGGVQFKAKHDVLFPSGQPGPPGPFSHLTERFEQQVGCCFAKGESPVQGIAQMLRQVCGPQRRDQATLRPGHQGAA
jgi:hypothetical protein